MLASLVDDRLAIIEATPAASDRAGEGLPVPAATFDTFRACGATGSRSPRHGVPYVTTARIGNGFVWPAVKLALLTESDLAGHPAGLPTTRDMRRMPSRRRGGVDPLQLKPGDYVVHEQHGGTPPRDTAGGQPLRDNELLAWCGEVIRSVLADLPVGALSGIRRERYENFRPSKRSQTE